MNRTYLLDEITKIRRVIIEKSGKFTLKECESIAAALEVVTKVARLRRGWVWANVSSFTI